MMAKKKIALYGLGTETEKAINKLSDECNIIGLLDGYKTEGCLYGKPVLPIETAVNEGIERIIVVARPGSCKAIAKRISELCKANNVELYDIRGKNLLYQNRKQFGQKELERYLERITGNKRKSNNIRIDLFLTRMCQIHKNTLDIEQITVTDPYDIGYLFCAPMIADFVLWFAEVVKKEKFHNIWFFARDGYLIHKLYQMLNPEGTGEYVYTSRIAAVRSGVESEEDLRYVDSMKFSGSLEANLQQRFGISAGKEEIDSEGNILHYKDIIFDKSAEVRKGYKKYIEGIACRKGDIVVFDFVAKGTTQYFMQRMTGSHLKGFYFLQLEPEYMKEKDLDISPFYTAEELEKSVIFDDYYILETILTSPEPTVVEFDQNGKPVFAAETRSDEELECINRIQMGIIEYFKDYLNRCSDQVYTIDKEADEAFLSLIHHIEIKNDSFKRLIIEDPFFNRATSITDIL